MRSSSLFFITLLLTITFMVMATSSTVSATGLQIPVTWSPFTNEFKALNFTFPVNMTHFPTGAKDNTYIIKFTVTGMELDGSSIDVDAITTSIVGTDKIADGELKTYKRDDKNGYKVKFPAARKDAGSFTRHAIIYIRSKKSTNPTVQMSIQSDSAKDIMIVDETPWSQFTAPASLGKFSIKTFKNDTDSEFKHTGFKFTIQDFSPPTEAVIEGFTITDVSQWSSGFVVRKNPSTNLCTFNGKAVTSSVNPLANNQLVLTHENLSSFGKKITIECQHAGLSPATKHDKVLIAKLTTSGPGSLPMISQVLVKGKVSHVGTIIVVFLILILIAIGGFFLFRCIKNRRTSPKGEQRKILGGDYTDINN